MTTLTTFSTVLLLSLSLRVYGHVAAWHKGMYCLNGTVPGEDNGNNNNPVVPMFKLQKEDWWMHHFDKCDEFPPAPGDFLELPANGNFTVELATNRAFTSLSYDGQKAGTFTGPLRNNLKDSEFGVTKAGEVPKCITDPNIHTENETMASGTAFAISYQSDLKKVTPENLVVFTVLYHTPWERLATYQVPNLPACPPGGCHCAWGWVPNGCGEPNMYMMPYKCNVTGIPGSLSLAPAKPAVWCEDAPGNCTQNAKQMIFWNQLEGDNIEVEGNDLSGSSRSPAYNNKLGFKNGAQTDIFFAPPAETPQSQPPQSPFPQSQPPQTQIPQSLPTQTVPPQSVPSQTAPPQSVPSQSFPPQSLPPQSLPSQLLPPQSQTQTAPSSTQTQSMITIRLSAGLTASLTTSTFKPTSTTTVTGTPPASTPSNSASSAQNSALSHTRACSLVELFVAVTSLVVVLL